MHVATPSRRYRATLIPNNLELDDVAPTAARGMLPVVRIKAADAEQAAYEAHRRHGCRVLKVERVEP